MPARARCAVPTSQANPDPLDCGTEHECVVASRPLRETTLSSLDLSSLADLLPELPDLTPLVWAAAGVIALFAIAVLLLLPFALAPGQVGVNARHVLSLLLGVFHHLIEVCQARRGSR